MAEYEEEISFDEAKAGLRINKHELERELSEQPDLFARVAHMAVLWAGFRDTAKHKLAVVEAEVSALVRQQFADEGSKVTETAVKEEVVQHPNLKNQTRKYLETRREADLWQGYKDAYEQRGRMIRDLCQLYIAGYYQNSAVRGDSEAAKNARADVTRKKLAENRVPLTPRKRG